MNCIGGIKAKEKLKIKEKTIQESVHYMLIAFIQYLGDRRGYKPESICEAMKYIMGHAEAIAGEYTTLPEAEDDIYENYGVYFDDNGNVCYDEDYKIHVKGCDLKNDTKNH